MTKIRIKYLYLHQALTIHGTKCAAATSIGPDKYPSFQIFKVDDAIEIWNDKGKLLALFPWTNVQNAIPQIDEPETAPVKRRAGSV